MLTTDQIDFYRTNGYLALDGQLSTDETELLLRESRRLAGMDVPQRIHERDGVNVRSVYAVHQQSEAFERLTRDVRTLEPGRLLLEDDVYIHQTQLNFKTPFVGDVWEWHQDYTYWARDDGMPTPQALNVAVFLDEVTDFNGPLFVMPGSHRRSLDERTGTHKDGWQHTLTADLRHKITPETLTDMADEFGLVSIKGKPGTVVVFDGQLVHCSPPNLSGNPRTVIFIRYNSVHNALLPVANPRPAWLASRDLRPLEVLSEPFAAVGAH